MYVEPDTGHVWHSPSDLTRYLSAPWVFAQQVAVTLGERDDWQRPQATTMDVAAELGDAHERAYLAKLEQDGRRIARIERAKGDWTEAVELTRQALADDSIDVIYQAHLVGADGQWRGQADFLERAADGSWEPVDTKLSRSVKPAMVLQLCFYADAVSHLTGTLPAQFHVELGSNERESFRTNDYLLYTRKAQARLADYVASEAWRDEYPWPSDELATAGLDDEAEAIWRRDDHPVQIAGITRRQIQRFADAGITTMAAIAAATERPPGMAAATFERTRRQAELQKRAKPDYELLEPQPHRGFAVLPRPNRGDIFYDIEGDPLWQKDRGLEYLHGLWLRPGGTGEYEFEALWAHDLEQEREAFEQLIDLFTARRAEFPRMHIYHYAPYETSALKRLAQLHGTREEALDDLLRGDVFVDLYQVVRQGLQAGVPSYSIKSMEVFYMEEREAAVKEGGGSIVEYERFRELEGTPEGDAILADIGHYNQEDCESTQLLRDWLLQRKSEAIDRWGHVHEDDSVRESEDFKNASPMSGEQSPQQEHRSNLLIARERLNLAATDNGDPESLRLLGELLLFNVREMKSSYWELLSRYAMTLDETIEDSVAIGGLSMDGGGDAGGRRFVFPPQDFKVRVGDSLRDTDMQHVAGIVTAIDDETNTIEINLSGDAKSSPPVSVFPHKYLPTEVIDTALLALADVLVEGRPDFPAAQKVLRRELPYFGEELHGSSAAELREQLDDLDGSYLVAQGPPGTGKTHTAADLIVDQLIKGNRVGVTAQSHSTIAHLLDKVEETAIERGHVFAGVKVGGEVYECESGMTKHLKSGVPGEDATLVGGTAWCFSKPELRQAFDVIVIDEAGQFSLAHALAVATAAKTLVMVGDPNQLPQVTTGSHPFGAGASALEHILGEHRTVPPELGVFLPETWRLWPELCEVVSENFYEGRLRSKPMKRVNRCGELRSGVHLELVEHEGNRQDSIEEARRVAELCDSLLNDAELEPDDLMVVTPFNMQADLIEKTLEHPVPVYTVDRCQGREAEIVIYSLATSGGEKAPRGNNFLFSSNRLNVAISRARYAAFLVCSPELLATECDSIADMALLNRFVDVAVRAATD